MKLPETSVKHPITVLMGFIGGLVLGLMCYCYLPIDMMPDLEPPSISVITSYFGVSAVDIEEKVSQVVENELSTIGSVDEISSISKENLSIVAFKFRWGTNLDVVVNDIRDKLEFAKWRLPREIEPPIIFRFGTEMFPVLFYGVNADESFPKLRT